LKINDLKNLAGLKIIVASKELTKKDVFNKLK
jgi:hypothetical protein